MRKGDGGKKGRKGEEMTKTEFWKRFIEMLQLAAMPHQFFE